MSEDRNWVKQLVACADDIRIREGGYIWVAPIKFYENNDVVKVAFAYEIEYADGKTESKGYFGDEFNSYGEALNEALKRFQ